MECVSLSLSLRLCGIPTLPAPPAVGHTICLCSQCLNYVFPFLIKKERKKEKAVMPLEQNNKLTVLSVSVKLLSNCCRGFAGGGGLISAFLPFDRLPRPCRSQSPGMPHTFCLFYMSKQIVNWLIIFVLTMSFTAVGPFFVCSVCFIQI